MIIRGVQEIFVDDPTAGTITIVLHDETNEETGERIVSQIYTTEKTAITVIDGNSIAIEL